MADRITIDPQVHFGKPCVAGTRIPVQAVLELVREGIALPISFGITIRAFTPMTFVPAFNIPSTCWRLKTFAWLHRREVSGRSGSLRHAPALSGRPGARRGSRVSPRACSPERY